MSDAERAARLVALSAVVGLLIPGPEKADSSERLAGVMGVTACSSALQSESDTTRRVELALARAIHQIEAGHSAEAVADARAAFDLAQPLMADSYFARSLGLSVIEVNAATLLKAGKYSEAEAMGYKLADSAPYDVINQLHAWKYLNLTEDRHAEYVRYLDRLSRLWNGALKDRATQLEWEGRFAEAPAIFRALLSINEYAGLRDEHNDVTGYWRAREAVALVLAGDRAKSDALVAEARLFNERLASRRAVGNETTISLTDELIDFHRIASLIADGKLNEARDRFRQRVRWLAPTMGTLTVVVDRLREGAKAAELDGPLARSGSELRQDFFDQRRLALPENQKLASQLFRSIRPVLRSSDFRSAARSVWNTSKSRYLVEKKGELANKPYEFVISYDVYGHAAGYAVLLHSALLAQRRGKQGFVIVGDRKAANTIAVVYGNAGDPGTPAEMLIDARTVIDALRYDFPEPQQRN